MSNRKNTNSNSKIVSYLKLQFLSTIIYIILIILISAICVKADINKESMAYISLAFIGAASLISGFLAGIRERKNGIVCGLLGALPINLFMIAVSLITNKFSADLSILYTALICLISSAVGGIISVNIRVK